MKKKHGYVRIILVTVVLVAGGFLAVGCEDNGISPRFHELAEESFLETFDVTTQTTFQLRGINGSVEITGSATASRIEISGYRRVYSDTEEDAQDRLQDLQVEMSSTAESVIVETKQPQDTQGRNYTVEYDVTLPAGLLVNIVHVNGAVTVEKVAGDVAVVNINGDVVGRELGGDATLRTGNGWVLLDSDISAGASVEMTAANGNVELIIPARTSAWVTASLANGEIFHSGLDFSGLDVSQRSLHGRLGAGEASIELRTGNGNITLTGK